MADLTFVTGEQYKALLLSLFLLLLLQFVLGNGGGSCFLTGDAGRVPGQREGGWETYCPKPMNNANVINVVAAATCLK